ncbi:MAG: cation:proton antiporter [Candidatus Bathyarchaeota archaeon]|nr:cation:proton antiporter [Candidatus Bathyarchaeota archaeon]
MAIDAVLTATVTICILVFSAKVLGEVFAWRKIPSVLGELLAGMLLGPAAFGSFIAINGTPLIQINNDIVRAFGEIGGILILFVAGLEMTFKDFRKVGLAGFVIGAVGVIVPFVMGYGVSLALGYSTIASLVVGAALVATSISITALVLQELNRTRTEESKMMISAAVVDDVLGLAILGVIVTFISTSTPITPISVMLVISTSLALWLAMTVFAALVVPRIINWTSKGSEATVEAAATASCFGASALAAYLGLSPIVGAFAAGMAIASSNTIEKIRDYTKKISVIFSPVFFALAGAQFDIRSFITTDWFFYVFFIALVIVAVTSKMIGCGLPAAYFLKDRAKGNKVGIGMTSRGEVGLIVAGVAITAGAISQSTYAAILGMIMITTLIAPLLLRRAYDNEPIEEHVPTDEADAPDYIPTYPLNPSGSDKDSAS